MSENIKPADFPVENQNLPTKKEESWKADIFGSEQIKLGGQEMRSGLLRCVSMMMVIFFCGLLFYSLSWIPFISRFSVFGFFNLTQSVSSVVLLVLHASFGILTGIIGFTPFASVDTRYIFAVLTIAFSLCAMFEAWLNLILLLICLLLCGLYLVGTRQELTLFPVS